MSRLVWDTSGSKTYESGVDRGVFYPLEGDGVVWNGLVSVEEGADGGEVNSYHFDGVKYLDLPTPKTFQATITAFSAPRGFGACIGEKHVIPGFILTRQPRSRFHFSYRTRVGDSGAYILHLVYNALASPQSREYSTISDAPEAGVFSYRIDTTPPLSEIYRPSAHYEIDSRKIDSEALANLEDILYGTTDSFARMPHIDELLDIVWGWGAVTIIPDYISGLSDLDPGTGDLTKTRTPGIYRDISTTRLTKTAVGGLYRLESD